MSIKEIITEPNKILRQVSKPVEKVGKEEQSIMDDMLQTMYHANGIGLAAIQIGIPKRIIVMDIAKKDEQKNPMYEGNEHTLDIEGATTYGQHEFLDACKKMGIVKDID